MIVSLFILFYHNIHNTCCFSRDSILRRSPVRNYYDDFGHVVTLLHDTFYVIVEKKDDLVRILSLDQSWKKYGCRNGSVLLWVYDG